MGKKNMEHDAVFHSMNEPLLTTAQVAHWLGVCASVLEKDRSSRRFLYPKYILVGSRAIRYRRCDVEDWINSRSVSGPGLRR